MDIYAAARNGRLELVEHLVGQGMDVNATDDDGWTALHVAARLGHEEVVAYLRTR